MKCFLVFLLVFPFLFCVAQNPVAAPIVFKETNFDFGAVSKNNGPVVHRFYYYNRTAGPVTILSVNADCGTGILEWTKTPVKPNQGGVVVVSFDPKGKPGYFSKKISVQPDGFNNVINLQLSGHVVKNNHTPAKWQYKYGNLRVQQRSIHFKKAYINRATKPVDYPVFNDSNLPVAITKVVSPPYLQVRAVPAIIGPHKPANITVTYDAAKRKLGYHRDTIELWTNDGRQAVKKIPVYAMIEEYFPPLSDTAFFKAPIAVLDTALIDFGVVKTSSITKSVILRNAGLRELRIRDIIPNHFSVSVVSSHKSVLPANDTTWLKFMFTPYGQTGKLYKAATLFTTDPRSPTLSILMTMDCR